MKEKKPMKKGTRAFLMTLAVIAFVAVCFGCVGLYLVHERNKPVFTPPPAEPQPSVTALPEQASAGADYINALYQTMSQADDVEGDWHTDVHLGAIETPFAAADDALVQLVRDQAAGQIASFYPSASELVMADAADVPVLSIDSAKVLDYAARQGDVTEGSDDSIHYYLDFTLAPDEIDQNDVQTGEVYAKIAETLSPAMTVETLAITPTGETVSCTVDRLSDDLQSVKITKNYEIQASVRLSADYAALYDGDTADIELPYETVTYINFHSYGLRFYEQQLVARPDDVKALPLEVTVHSTATKEDYTLTFETTDDDALSIDDTGVMTVHAARDEAVKITATLDYDGHTYSDTLTLYITELEVKENV